MGFLEHQDFAAILLYLFWGFFAALIWYLHAENKREGYPLVSDHPLVKATVQGYPPPPSPKTFLLPHGGTVSVPKADGGADQRGIALKPAAPFPGAPFVPTGDPMQDGVGPASWTERADVPDLTFEGLPKIVPLRVATDFHLDARDPDPRGMTVMGHDGKPGGTVTDAWVDRSEYILRYYEVDTGGGKRVLLPVTFTTIDGKRGRVNVKAILGRQFANAPALRNPDQVTLREEDRICGYYGGGYLYSTPSRSEPLA